MQMVRRPHMPQCAKSQHFKIGSGREIAHEASLLDPQVNSMDIAVLLDIVHRRTGFGQTHLRVVASFPGRPGHDKSSIKHRPGTRCEPKDGI